ncbi:ATP-grasp fold amidoligase family protein [Pantoea stewartii]|uniref:ATP-grasp fold amidoligase family protein n=1 Tax=Pantoea stewartii TaxID=66269 RepID=UPI0006D21365|nr:ATP-grasp fold amidoligase family protein [Pantoea stewartii]
MLRLKQELRRSLQYFIKKMPWTYQDRIYYFRKFRKLPNLREPKVFNEKVLYRKFIHGDYQLYARLSDKYSVRDYIAEKIGNDYLIPLLHDTTDPTTLNDLTRWQGTVIKPNHASNMVEIVLEEPDALRKQQIIHNCCSWLKTDFANEAREIHYRYIKPRILVEQYIGDGKSAPVDYKFHMFNKRDGNFEYVLQVIYNRCQPQLSMNFYVNNLCEAYHKIRDTGLDVSPIMPSLERALALSKTLASDFDYVRVDWYIHDQHIYFGELTFTPGAGMVTGLDRGLDKMMGEMWIQERRGTQRPDVDVQDVAIPVMLKKI